MTDARIFLTGLTGVPLRTITQHKPNRVLSVEGGHVVVATEVSPDGARVPIALVQAAMDALYRDGELRINKATLKHRRTAFVGAVLRELPDVEVLTNPQRVRTNS
jgi:hypothetical protein